MMRMFGDALRKRTSDVVIVVFSLAVATIGFATLGIKPGFVVSVVAFAAVGAGLGFVFPYLFALAGRQMPQRRAAAMSFAATVSGGPRFVFPWILGLLAASYGISTVFVLCAFLAFFSLVMIVTILSGFTEVSVTKEGASLR
jgi:MFS family permease